MRLLTRLWSNWITLLGSVIVSISGFGFILLLVIGLSTAKGNPYQGLLAAIGVPVALGIGISLILIGLRVERDRRGSKDAVQAAFELAFNDPRTKRRFLFVAVSTVSTVGLFALAGQKTIEHMDSPQFCGTTCHSAMGPEWEAYNRSPHSNVACVGCHIGPGAAAEIKAKWNGIHQLNGILTSNYSRPVVAVVGDLPPARSTCLQCHSRERWRADRVKLFPHYDLDKANTPKFNALAMRLGGLNRLSQKYVGIHWHADPDREITFEYLDPQRQKIGKVTLSYAGKLVAEYLPTGATATEKPLGVHSMDCTDCHNRPTHVFDGTPKNAVDRALFLGALDPAAPYLAKVSVALLTDAVGKVPRDDADAHFKDALAATYQREHPDATPDAAALDKASKTLSTLYLRNVFPSMKIGWNQYSSNIGHQTDGPGTVGCFRCHDKQHEATLADGKKKKINQECDSCHTGIVFDQSPEKFDDTLAALIPATP